MNKESLKQKKCRQIVFQKNSYFPFKGYFSILDLNLLFPPQFEAYVVTGMIIDWSGAGGWKPEKVTVDITMDICCKNIGSAVADASNSPYFDCGQGSAFCS